MTKRIFASLLFLLACATSTRAFAPHSSSSAIGNAADRRSSPLPPSSSSSPSTTSSSSPPPPTTCLSMGRQWNFNNGRSPWGLKKNAEIWNGRVAQMAFVIVLLQEAITGRGVIDAIRDGDALGYAFLGLAGVSTIGLTIWLAIKGDESDIIF
ncbi:hypothetical protein ACHAXA_002306 [Cyclostephanos tholiformis]|uniref:Uncharacterized protein n=1 Tax=Cyclostephanos tholiformis TaxID=382380 RepID=A0ABD3SRS2_9STRA